MEDLIDTQEMHYVSYDSNPETQTIIYDALLNNKNPAVSNIMKIIKTKPPKTKEQKHG